LLLKFNGNDKVGGRKYREIFIVAKINSVSTALISDIDADTCALFNGSGAQLYPVTSSK